MPSAMKNENNQFIIEAIALVLPQCGEYYGKCSAQTLDLEIFYPVQKGF